jgi:hypothetical protein
LATVWKHREKADQKRYHLGQLLCFAKIIRPMHLKLTSYQLLAITLLGKIIRSVISNSWSWGRVVGIAIRLRVGRFEVQISVGLRDLSTLQKSTPVLLPMEPPTERTPGFFRRGQRGGGGGV